MADIDVVSDILAASQKAFPDSNFIGSLSHQYLTRGWLTKKQLQGLHSKASKVYDINPGKLATLQAMITRMPTKTKSEKPTAAPIVEDDGKVLQQLDDILSKYPQHKRVLYLKSKVENHQHLTPTETAEAERFHKLLIKK